MERRLQSRNDLRSMFGKGGRARSRWMNDRIVVVGLKLPHLIWKSRVIVFFLDATAPPKDDEATKARCHSEGKMVGARQNPISWELLGKFSD